MNGIKYDFARVTGRLKAESMDRMVVKRFQIDIRARWDRSETLRRIRKRIYRVFQLKVVSWI